MVSISRTALCLAIVLLLAISAPAFAWKIDITSTPDGQYVASLIHSTDPTKDHTVGKYKTKREARKAAKAAKKKANNGVYDDGSGNCDDPRFKC